MVRRDVGSQSTEQNIKVFVRTANILVRIRTVWS